MIPAFLLRRQLRARFERARSEYRLATHAYTHDPGDDTMTALLLAHYTLELTRADYLACAGIGE